MAKYDEKVFEDKKYTFTSNVEKYKKRIRIGEKYSISESAASPLTTEQQSDYANVLDTVNIFCNKYINSNGNGKKLLLDLLTLMCPLIISGASNETYLKMLCRFEEGLKNFEKEEI